MAESVTITDNRTGESIEIPIVNGGVDAGAWKKLLGNLWFADPGFTQTAATESAITELDGEAGILRYRGYPIEQLAERSTYLEVAYLLIYGELPTAEQYADWKHEITYHTFIHENVRKRFMEGFHHDAHPMGMLVSAVAALSTFYPEAKEIHDEAVRDKQIVRLIAKMPTLAAGAHRFSVGMPFVYPDNRLDFASNFLSMMWKIAEPEYQADPILARALDILFILHADHEQNCGTTAMRVAGSSHADPYSAAAAATAALYGPRHGGANEAVIKMLNEIGHVDEVPAYVAAVKEGKGRLQGFGHRVYKNYDPRATIIKKTAYDVFEVTGKNPLLDIALKLEEVALADDYFVSRKLYPNVDFYSGLIYQAMGFPIEMFTVLFAIPRTAGWLAHWKAPRAGPEDRPSAPALHRLEARATTWRWTPADRSLLAVPVGGPAGAGRRALQPPPITGPVASKGLRRPRRRLDRRGGAGRRGARGLRRRLPPLDRHVPGVAGLTLYEAGSARLLGGTPASGSAACASPRLDRPRPPSGAAAWRRASDQQPAPARRRSWRSPARWPSRPRPIPKRERSGRRRQPRLAGSVVPWALWLASILGDPLGRGIGDRVGATIVTADRYPGVVAVRDLPGFADAVRPPRLIRLGRVADADVRWRARLRRLDDAPVLGAAIGLLALAASVPLAGDDPRSVRLVVLASSAAWIDPVRRGRDPPGRHHRPHPGPTSPGW
ncbi:MAG: citrate synthase [Acidimicrobiales bacterium]